MGKFSVTERADVLYKFIDIVELNKESLAQTLCAENGKPITEARAEIGNIKIAFRAFAEHAKHYYGSIIPPGTEAGQENHIQMVTREPIGVVACIIPFNFPCDLYDQKVAPALMMGNAAIVLPSSDNPLTLMRLTDMLVWSDPVPDGSWSCKGCCCIRSKSSSGNTDRQHRSRYRNCEDRSRKSDTHRTGTRRQRCVHSTG